MQTDRYSQSDWSQVSFLDYESIQILGADLRVNKIEFRLVCIKARVLKADTNLNKQNYLCIAANSYNCQLGIGFRDTSFCRVWCAHSMQSGSPPVLSTSPRARSIGHTPPVGLD